MQKVANKEPYDDSDSALLPAQSLLEKWNGRKLDPVDNTWVLKW